MNRIGEGDFIVYSLFLLLICRHTSPFLIRHLELHSKVTDFSESSQNIQNVFFLDKPKKYFRFFWRTEICILFVLSDCFFYSICTTPQHAERCIFFSCVYVPNALTALRACTMRIFRYLEPNLDCNYIFQILKLNIS